MFRNLTVALAAAGILAAVPAMAQNVGQTPNSAAPAATAAPVKTGAAAATTAKHHKHVRVAHTTARHAKHVKIARHVTHVKYAHHVSPATSGQASTATPAHHGAAKSTTGAAASPSAN